MNDFMFIYDMKGMDEESTKKFDAKGMLKELSEISPNVKARANGLCFMVTNTNCRICGQWSSWKMNFC